MNAIRIGKMILVVAGCAAFLASGASVAGEQATLKVFYFGNSFLENSVPFASKHAHSRDYVWKLMDELKAKYPKLWQEKRLALIPNGDVFLAFDKRLRAGEMPGIENVGFFSRDGGHVRAGLPRYTLAATCYAVMFGEHPGQLDAAIYNDLENYRNENLNKLPGKTGPGYVHWPDLGELLEITPERKKIVDDTIWEVVQGHPYTHLTGRSRK